ncbi:Uncharacterised protein [Mycobacterium tuberculosis]|nr:Uncharacterised protein [Mycobacterium tuberculosis]
MIPRRKHPLTSSIDIGGSNQAPIQQITAEHAHNVSQSVHGTASPMIDDVRRLLAEFLQELEQHSDAIPAHQCRDAGDAAATIDVNLDDVDAGRPALRTAVNALPALIAGTVVEQAGTALAQAVRALVN